MAEPQSLPGMLVALLTLFDTDGTTTIDTFSSPSDPGDGNSIERIDYTLGDSSSNWAAASTYCIHGRSPARLMSPLQFVQSGVTEATAGAVGGSLKSMCVTRSTLRTTVQ